MKSAIIYVRVSTEEQAKHGFSVETQTTTCLEFAQKQGYVVKKIYIEEGLSAKDLNRPEAQKLLKYCNSSSNDIQAIIVWRLDRLSRFNVDYHGTIRPILMNHNIKLLSATELNSDTIEGEYVRNVMMCNAEYELSLIRFRTKENMKTIAQSGRKPCKAPLGYLNKDKKIIIDESNAKYIKRAFELYSTGMYSFKSLGDFLFQEGFKNPKTNEKYPARKFEWMLHNPFYMGRFIWSGEMYDGTHTPIITKDLFYRVQSLFKDTDRTKKHNVKFAYTNLIKCSECGCYYTAEFKRGKNKKGHYIYYHCSNSKNYHKSVKSYREEYFDNTFSNMLETIHINESTLQKIRFLTSDYLKEFSEYEKQTSSKIKQQIDVLSKRIKNSYIDKLEGNLPASMSESEFNEMHQEWQQEKDQLLIKLQECNISSKFLYSKIDFILKFSERLPELFLKATPEEKKLILTTMTNSISFDGENLLIDLKDTFKLLQDVKKTSENDLRNTDLRTLENSSISTKKDVLKTSFENGAPNGSILELLYKAVNTDYFSSLENNLKKFVA